MAFSPSKSYLYKSDKLNGFTLVMIKSKQRNSVIVEQEETNSKKQNNNNWTTTTTTRIKWNCTKQNQNGMVCDKSSRLKQTHQMNQNAAAVKIKRCSISDFPFDRIFNNRFQIITANKQISGSVKTDANGKS